MARKRIVVSSAGGISAGTPFVLNAGMFVSQASPPVANTGRFARLADVVQSLVAPGVGPAGTNGSANSFVMGSAASDGPNTARAVVIGFQVTAYSGAVALNGDDQILIGNRLTPGGAIPGQDGLIAIGANMTFSAGGGAGNGYGSSILMGRNLIITGQDPISNVALGDGLTVRGGLNVVLGAASNGGQVASGQSVVIGANATGNQSQLVVVGQTAGGSNVGGIALGWNATSTGDYNIGIGFSARARGTSSIVIGRDADDATFASCIVIGRKGVAFEANSCTIGNDASGTYDMRILRLGPNTLAGYGGLSILLPNAGAGVDSAAPVMTMRAGLATGASVSGDIVFQTGIVHGSDAVYQTATERVRIVGGVVVGGDVLKVTGNALITSAVGPIFRLVRTTTGNRYDIQTDGTDLQFVARDAGSIVGNAGGIDQFAILPSAGGAGAASVNIKNLTNAAAAQAATLLNGPVAGNPTFWAPIQINGVVKYIPCW